MFRRLSGWLTVVPTGESHRVTTLELLFDLVFVFAITSVTSAMSHHLDATGLAQGLVVMALIWFGWSAYTWLGNQARADEGALRVAMIGAMAGFFVVALTIGEAFGDHPGGLPGPVAFAVAYAVVRLAHLATYTVAAGADAELRRTIRRVLLSTAPTLAILFVGAFVEAHWRLLLWFGAVLVDYVGIFIFGAKGWRVHAPGHFAERHQLVVLIAIGESIVAVGVGVSHAPISWPLLLGAALGIAVAVALWWTYFDVVALVAERTLTGLTGDDRTRLARDSFTYLHMPVVVGVVYLALGTKVILTQAAGAGVLGGHDALRPAALVALYGGSALYLFCLSMLKWRDVGTPNYQRLVVAALLVAVGMLTSLGDLPAMAHLAIVAAAFVGLVTFEATTRGAIRQAVRHPVAGDGTATHPTYDG